MLLHQVCWFYDKNQKFFRWLQQISRNECEKNDEIILKYFQYYENKTCKVLSKINCSASRAWGSQAQIC